MENSTQNSPSPNCTASSPARSPIVGGGRLPSKRFQNRCKDDIDDSHYNNNVDKSQSASTLKFQLNVTACGPKTQNPKQNKATHPFPVQARNFGPSTMLRPLPLLLFLLFLLSRVNSHQESGEWSCESDSESRIEAEFRPGLITLDGHADDWKDIDGFEFPLRPALDPDEDHEYKGGKMTVKALHDGHDVFFLLQVDGDYVYSKGNSKKCPSMALMFQIGEDASYHGMGGCAEEKDTCTNKTCKGHEVDIMHFSIGNAIPGRLYGGNPIDNRDGYGGDRFGHLVDLYAWTPHCRYLDGTGPSGNDTSAQNEWKGAWWHSSFSVHSGFVEEDSPYASGGQKGTYYFEFSRPLRTMDRLQQDAQFTIGGSSKMSVGFWYPLDGQPWHGSGHYSINCDWVPLDISSGNLRTSARGGSGNVSSAFALLLSVVSICMSVFVGYRLFKPKHVPFTPMENL